MLKAKLAKIHKSLTIWFNGVAGTIVAGLPIAQDSFPQLQPYISPHWYQYAMGGIIGANILLRFKTDKGLEQK